MKKLDARVFGDLVDTKILLRCGVDINTGPIRTVKTIIQGFCTVMDTAECRFSGRIDYRCTEPTPNDPLKGFGFNFLSHAAFTPETIEPILEGWRWAPHALLWLKPRTIVAFLASEQSHWVPREMDPASVHLIMHYSRLLDRMWRFVIDQTGQQGGRESNEVWFMKGAIQRLEGVLASQLNQLRRAGALLTTP